MEKQPVESTEEAKLEAVEGIKKDDSIPPKAKEQIVTAFDVEAGEEGVDYKKLIEQFG